MIFGGLMKICSLLVLSFLSLSTYAYTNDARFPAGPNSKMTPGKLCDSPSSYRYPEHIAYCERNVDPQTKAQIIKAYDQQFGYKIESMSRNEFKIDHLIPLCAGGSNDITNLWPQNRAVYEITDPVEPLICAQMEAGKLTQAQAVILVMKAKNNLDQVPEVLNTLNNL